MQEYTETKWDLPLEYFGIDKSFEYLEYFSSLIFTESYQNNIVFIFHQHDVVWWVKVCCDLEHISMI